MGIWSDIRREVEEKADREEAEHDQLVRLGRKKKYLSERLDDVINQVVYYYRWRRSSTKLRRLVWKLVSTNKITSGSTVYNFVALDHLNEGELTNRRRLLKESLRQVFRPTLRPTPWT